MMALENRFLGRPLDTSGILMTLVNIYSGYYYLLMLIDTQNGYPYQKQSLEVGSDTVTEERKVAYLTYGHTVVIKSPHDQSMNIG